MSSFNRLHILRDHFAVRAQRRSAVGWSFLTFGGSLPGKRSAAGGQTIMDNRRKNRRTWTASFLGGSAAGLVVLWRSCRAGTTGPTRRDQVVAPSRRAVLPTSRPHRAGSAPVRRGTEHPVRQQGRRQRCDRRRACRQEYAGRRYTFLTTTAAMVCITSTCSR